MIRQEDLDLIADTKAFNPEPVRIEAPWWLEGACWVALVVITVGTTILLWRIK